MNKVTVSTLGRLYHRGGDCGRFFSFFVRVQPEQEVKEYMHFLRDAFV
jgi:hypothetical protein